MKRAVIAALAASLFACGGEEPVGSAPVVAGLTLSRTEVTSFLDAPNPDVITVVRVLGNRRTAEALRLDGRALRTWFAERMRERNARGHVPSLKPYTPPV